MSPGITPEVSAEVEIRIFPKVSSTIPPGVPPERPPVDSHGISPRVSLEILPEDQSWNFHVFHQ